MRFIPNKIVLALNIKFIHSKIKNQITQRNNGIKKSKSDYILQIDDDVKINRNFFQKLEKYTKKKNFVEKKIISALILQKNNILQAGSWNMIYKKYYLFRKLIWFLNYFKKINEYSVLESGRCIPYIENFNGLLDKNVSNAEWLCSTVLYHRSFRKKIIYLNDFSKKAYYEDVLFSHQLYKKNYNLIIDKNIIGFHESQPYTSLLTFIQTIKMQYALVKFFKKKKIFILHRCAYFFLYTFN